MESDCVEECAREEICEECDAEEPDVLRNARLERARTLDQG